MPQISFPFPAPVALTPLLVERIWGADSLGPWYPPVPPGKPIGEVWLTAEPCTVAGTDVTLAELAAEFPENLHNVDAHGFPLLIKLLYPREKLSVQVHPNDAQAQAMLGQARGKTECWYVLSAEPGAQVALGFREAMTVEQVKKGLLDGTIEDKLRLLPVSAGDMVFVDANTVHAIGPGMVVLEVQQYSDVTYRLWDYGRPRELHIEDGLAVTRTDTAAGLVVPRAMENFDRLVACPYFTVDRFRLAASGQADLHGEGELQVLVALGNGCSLQRQGGETVRLPPGHAVVVPAADGAYTLHADGSSEIIRVLGPNSGALCG